MAKGSLLQSEIERGPDFLRLANALSALYPKDSDEKRLPDAMLPAVPSCGGRSCQRCKSLTDKVAEDTEET